METKMDGNVVSSTNEVPFFDVMYYSAWRIKMKGYLKSKGEGDWDTFVAGSVPLKNQSRFTCQKEEKKNNVVESKTILNGLLGFFKEIIGQCTSAKDLWLKLEKEYQDSVINEGKDSPKYSDYDNSKCNDVECVNVSSKPTQKI
jgi:hypothetical protein